MEQDPQRSSMWPPAAQGMYDPGNEHDACGLGFIAHIKGRKSHADHPARAVDPREPHAPRRHGRRSAAGGRRRHPDPASRHLPAPRVRQARDHAAGHRPVRRRHGVPAAGARVAHGVRAGNRARDRRRGPGAARLARRAGEQRGAVRAHEGGRARHPADLRRPRQPRPRPGRPRAQAVRDPQARGPRDPVAAPAARQGVLRPVAVHADDHLQGHAARAPGRRVLLGPRGRRRWCRRSRWSTSASRPTRSRRGTWRIRSASSATTARSTRCAATSTGSARARARSPRRCWATTCRSCGR